MFYSVGLSDASSLFPNLLYTDTDIGMIPPEQAASKSHSGRASSYPPPGGKGVIRAAKWSFHILSIAVSICNPRSLCRVKSVVHSCKVTLFSPVGLNSQREARDEIQRIIGIFSDCSTAF